MVDFELVALFGATAIFVSPSFLTDPAYNETFP